MNTKENTNLPAGRQVTQIKIPLNPPLTKGEIGGFLFVFFVLFVVKSYFRAGTETSCSFS